MPTFTISSKAVYPEVLFGIGHTVNRWMVGITAEVKAAARSKAPPRRSRGRWAGRQSTGALRASIRGKTVRRGGLIVTSEVSATAPYVNYVLKGTAFQGHRYIYSAGGWANKGEVDRIARRVARGGKAGEDTEGFYMRLPLTGVGGHRIFHLRVHGQRANNFLADGYNEVAAAHGALRPIRNKYAF